MLDKDLKSKNLGPTKKSLGKLKGVTIFFLLGIGYIVGCILYVFFG